MAILEEPRTLFIALMLICPAIAIINSVIFGNTLKQFALRMRMLSSYDDILYFQRVVKQQMYAAGMVGLNVCVAVDTKKLAQFWPPTISFFFQ